MNVFWKSKTEDGESENNDSEDEDEPYCSDEDWDSYEKPDCSIFIRAR